MASKLKLTELLHPDSAVAAITINADNSVTIPTQSTTNLAYTGTLTGGTGVIAIGTNQIYKDASGNVGLGTASPSSGVKLDVIGKTKSTTLDIGTTAGQTLDLFKIGSDNYIWCANAAPILFGTNNTERMRIDSSGNLLVGTTNLDPIGARVNATTFRSGSIGTRSVNGNEFGIAGSSGAQITWYTDNGSTFVQAGSITSSGSTTAYNTSSDYRLKENVAPMTGALKKVAALKPCTYTWKADGSAGQGFIAHELQSVVPDCVTGEKDAVDKDGKPQYQGVDTSFLVATLVSALQEQQALIQDLTTRLNTLEGN